MKNWLERGVEYSIFLIVFLIPLLYFGGKFFIPHVTSKTFVFYGLVEIIFVVWIYLFLLDKKYRLSKKTLIIFSPLFALIIWLTIADILGINPEKSFWSSLGRGTGLLTLYHCLALAAIVASIIRAWGITYIRLLLMWFLGGSFIVTLSVWLGDEGLNLPFEFLQKSKGGGLIGNSSLVASYLLFSLFFCLFLLFMKEVSRRQKIWIGSIVAMIIFSPLFVNVYSLITKGDILISARGALLGIGVGVFVAITSYFVLSNNKILKYCGIGGLLIVFIIFIWGWVGLVNPDSIVHKKFTESASGSRFIFWDIAKKGIAERPLFGWGPENYSVVYQKYFNPEILKQSTTAEVWVDRPHNVIYEIGVAGGYPAMALYILLIVSLLFGVLRSFNLNHINRLQAGILWGLITGYIIQNLFVFDSISSYLGLFILTSIVYGLCDNSSNVENQNKKNVGEMNNILYSCILLILLSVMLLFFVILPLKKVAKISEVFTLPLNKRFEHYNDLLKISPVGDSWEISELAEDTYNLYSNNLEKIKKDPQIFSYSKKDLESFLGYLNIISQKEPYDYRLYLNMMRLSNIYAKLYGKGDQELIGRISEFGRRARELSPNHFNLIYSIKR